MVLRPNSVLCIHQAIILPLGYIPSLNVQGFMQLNLVGFFLRHHFLVSSAGVLRLLPSPSVTLRMRLFPLYLTNHCAPLWLHWSPCHGLSTSLTPNFTGLSTLALIWHLVTVFRANPYAPAGFALICWCSQCFICENFLISTSWRTKWTLSPAHTTSAICRISGGQANQSL